MEKPVDSLCINVRVFWERKVPVENWPDYPEIILGYAAVMHKRILLVEHNSLDKMSGYPHHQLITTT